MKNKMTSAQYNEPFLEYSDDDGDSIPDIDDHIEATLTVQRISKKLQMWYTHYQPSSDCVRSLLEILNEEGLNVTILINTVNDHKDIKIDNVAAVGNEVAVQRNTNSLHNYKEQLMAQSKDLESQMNAEHDYSLAESEVEDTSSEYVLQDDTCRDGNGIITELQEQLKQMNTKIGILMQEIAKVNVRIDKREPSQTTVNRLTAIFPIANINGLAKLEQSLKEDNISTYIASVKKLIHNDDMSKSITRILSKEILIEHNLDGVQNKLALKAYPKILNLLYKSFESKYDTPPEFRMALKHAMKRVKNKIYKDKCMNKKKSLQSDADMLMFI